jgi:hypothetical protein
MKICAQVLDGTAHEHHESSKHFSSLPKMKSFFVLAASSFAQILWNCPKPSEIKSQFVKDNFNITEFASGKRFYEIAYKDMTQPRLCKCITSQKVYSAGRINDTFTIECGGRPFKSGFN